MTTTELGRLIGRRIALTGPISLADFMAEALGHPRLGYYRRALPVGASGDFTTAPEISQMFGELIGAWLAERWLAMGSLSPVNLVELGPGRGTLMADALRATRGVPGFHAAFRLQLVETNQPLRAEQQRTLGAFAPAWHERFDDVPGGPALIVANEFFDALPVHQAVKTPGGWCERRVGIDGDKLVFTPAAEPLAGLDARLPASAREAADGAIFEWRDDGAARALGARLAQQGGAALVIDYGHVATAIGDTLQALGGHAFADPLATPGALDLTAHVDFAALMRAVVSVGAATFGPISQSELLQRLGIAARAAKLKEIAAPDIAAQIDAAVARLTGTGRTEMGTLFKAAAFAHPKLGAPPAFES